MFYCVCLVKTDLDISVIHCILSKYNAEIYVLGKFFKSKRKSERQQNPCKYSSIILDRNVSNDNSCKHSISATKSIQSS